VSPALQYSLKVEHGDNEVGYSNWDLLHAS
jgi:hypothetical protein